jgi:hypothetical protein
MLLRFKKLDDCSVADIIPETSSLTARGVIKLFEEAGLNPSEIESFVEWARGIGLRPDKCYAAAAFREVMETARSAFSGRFDSLHINLLIPKRDKETLTNCKPSEC